MDLLLLYDAELISGTERAKDEFFHLFESAKKTGTKILIAADRVPSGIDDIDERLRTRFEMGLVVEAPGTNLPQGAGELNLEAAPPEYMQEEDLWGGFMRPKVSDTILPPMEGVQPEPAPAVEPAGKAEPAPALTPAPEAPVVEAGAPAVEAPAAGVADGGPAVGAEESAGQGSVWKPSKENVVWDWQAAEERIVELTEWA